MAHFARVSKKESILSKNNVQRFNEDVKDELHVHDLIYYNNLVHDNFLRDLYYIHPSELPWVDRTDRVWHIDRSERLQPYTSCGGG